MSFTWFGSLPGHLSDEGSEDAQALAEEGRDLHLCDGCGALVPGPERQRHVDHHEATDPQQVLKALDGLLRAAGRTA